MGENTPQVNAYMHVYEATLPKGMHSYEDPHSSGYSDYESDDYDDDNIVPENTNKIVRYTNRHEDPGSRSYIIPRRNVDGKLVKHVGTIPFTLKSEFGSEDSAIRELGYDT